jgi:hypothetical protein
LKKKLRFSLYLNFKVDYYNEKPLRKVNNAVLVFPEFVGICLSLSELGRILLTQLRRDI